MNTIKRLVVALGLLALMGGLAYQVGQRFFVRVYAQPQISIRPSIIEYYSFVATDKGERKTADTTEMRTRDGSMQRITTHYNPSGEVATFRGIWHPDGNDAFISDAVHAKSTFRRPAKEQAALNADFLRPDLPNCSAAPEIVEGEETLYGHSAVRIIVPQSDTKRVIDWRLPEFRCLSVQNFTQSRANKNADWKTTIGNRLTRFTETDPPAEAFTNYLGYDEMKPSDIGRRLARAAGKTPQTCPKCFGDDASDKNYEKWRKEEGK